ncbi:Lon family ATP-dependent protease [Sporohalobacter salinus]|uniref:Lon family ATP-dependent protease n=1 Tax=Sporohalobacter salinus TaxID=1494606 RepID=UPI001961EACE|nr:Lon family ATP-dependent protease [Sporohalobacter salinus]MBM7624330.1 ATP-dependent Lon protease [Sporohalobacter salinus]
MKQTFQHLSPKKIEQIIVDQSQKEQLQKKVTALFNLLVDFYGTEEFTLKVTKLDALDLVESELICEQLIALQRLVYEDPTLNKVIGEHNGVGELISILEEEITDRLVQNRVNNQLEERIAKKMQQRQKEYMQEIKREILSEEESKADTPAALKKYCELEKLEEKGLANSTTDLLRPNALKEVVGQDKAVKALLSKLASPFPQHIIIYGPPGVGKTTAARLGLQRAKELSYTPFDSEANFVEVDGTTLRWDPRETTNPLLGSVHDPIYQGARSKLAEGGIPEPKTGLVTKAHGGVLFIDEIGELDSMLQNKLLKVLEDKRVNFDSSYYDSNDEDIPQYIKKLFEDGAPADFILIGATTRRPEEINPALRSRAAEIFFSPLQREHIHQIITNACNKLDIDINTEVIELISQYTIEGRKAVNILADAYSLALYEAEMTKKGKKDIKITADEVYQVVQTSRLTPYRQKKAGSINKVGKIFGLGVSNFSGSILEIEAIAFSATEEGQGSIRFNETAGSMAKDSVFNAASVVRKITGENINDYDLHINIVGGGKIDGPSAGLAIVLSIISAIEEKPIRQDIAVSGEVSIRGKVKPVGGIIEKIYGAKQAGVKEIFLPIDNSQEVPQNESEIEINLVENIEEVLDKILVRKV